MADFTRQAIVSTFKKLLKNPKGTLTVKNITDTCNISRNTFYYHYDSLSALLQAELRIWFTDCKDTGAKTLTECTAPFIKAATAHKAEIINLCASSYDDVYFNFVVDLMRDRIHECVARMVDHSQFAPEHRPIIAIFCVNMLKHTFRDWMLHGMSYDIGAFIATMDELVTTGTLSNLTDEQMKQRIDAMRKAMLL